METVHRDRSGVAPFFRTQSGAREWTAALPSFVLSEDRPTRALTWPFAALLAAPILLGAVRPTPRTRTPAGRDILLACAAFMTVAVVADRASPRSRSPGRDAARLLGSPAVSLPLFTYVSSSPAVWPLDFFYEPHRSPSGAVFARQVPLRVGSYEITLRTRERLSPEAAPLVQFREERAGASSSIPAVITSDGVHAAIEITRDGAYDLMLGGGRPAVFQEGRLVKVR